MAAIEQMTLLDIGNGLFFADFLLDEPVSFCVFRREFVIDRICIRKEADLHSYSFDCYYADRDGNRLLDDVSRELMSQAANFIRKTAEGELIAELETVLDEIEDEYGKQDPYPGAVWVRSDRNVEYQPAGYFPMPEPLILVLSHPSRFTVLGRDYEIDRVKLVRDGLNGEIRICFSDEWEREYPLPIPIEIMNGVAEVLHEEEPEFPGDPDFSLEAMDTILMMLEKQQT